MLNNISIENFRGIEKLEINDFNKINLFVGRANTSKTSILEAIYIFIKESPKAIIDIATIRNMMQDSDIVDSIFYEYNTHDTLKFTGDIDNTHKTISIKQGQSQNLYIENNEETNLINISFTIDKNSISKEYSLNAGIINNKIHIESNAVESADNIDIISSYNTNNRFISSLRNIMLDNTKLKELINLCKSFDENIIDIRFFDNQLFIASSSHNRAVNINAFGNGFKTYLKIISSIVSGNKYIIIDEIENGLHFEAIKMIVEHIINFSESNNIQFFITTHNDEIIKAFSKKLDKTKHILSTYNIFKNDDDKVDIIRYPQDSFIHVVSNKNEIRD